MHSVKLLAEVSDGEGSITSLVTLRAERRYCCGADRVRTWELQTLTLALALALTLALDLTLALTLTRWRGRECVWVHPPPPPRQQGASRYARAGGGEQAIRAAPPQLVGL